MDANLNNLIKYYGTQSYETSNLIDFNQFSISSSFYIPKSNNSIDEITKVWAKINEIEYDLLKTPVATSCEGQILSGNKILISGILDVKIEYISLNETKNVESVYVSLPISTSVVLEEDLDEYQTPYPSILIEDIYCKKLDLSRFYINVMMVAVVDVF